MLEDIKRYREEKELEEENIIFQAIHKKHKEAHSNYKKALIKQEKKEKRTERLFIVGLVGLLVLSIIALNNLNKNFMEDCLKAGNSQYVCEKAK